VIERAIILSKGGRLQFKLPTTSKEPDTSLRASPMMEPSSELPYTETERLERERINIMAALQLANGKISGTDGAAELLGIKPTTLASRMKKLGIKKTPNPS